MAQRNRKIHKKRGTRSCGYGNAQKHRGAGSRGGRGNAGTLKHKQVKTIQSGRVFGKVGFKRHPSLRSKPLSINLSELDSKVEKWAEEGKAKKSASSYSINLSDLGYGKLLGKGKLTHKIEITVTASSEKAKKKTEEAGGKILTGDDIDSV